MKGGAKITSLNERIKELRKKHGLSQKDFAKKIGVSQRSVSWSEQPGNNVPDSTVKSLCMAFNANEDWLRYGTKPMYIQEPTFSLDKFVKDHGGTDLELEAMKAYFELEPDIRKMLVNHFKERLTASRDKPVETAATVEETEAAYIKSRLQNVQKTAASAMNTTTDVTRNENKASNQ